MSDFRSSRKSPRCSDVEKILRRLHSRQIGRRRNSRKYHKVPVACRVLVEFIVSALRGLDDTSALSQRLFVAVLLSEASSTFDTPCLLYGNACVDALAASNGF